jgi:PHD/YefM family antitoxin component YafN of YafNO toxin-antitoxin module
MTSISISQLKVNPSKAISSADDYPVAIEKHNKVAAYLLGKDLFNDFIEYIENKVDTKSVKDTDFSKGTDFEEFAKELGI